MVTKLCTRRVRQERPSLARRVVLVELSLIIGAILLLWGGSSLGRIHTAADRATLRMNELVAAGDLDLRRVPCGCAPCATLKVRGRDVGAILIGEGLAERHVCSGASCPPRRNWCFS